MNRKQLKTPLKVIILKGTEQVFEKTFKEYPITIGRSPKADVSLTEYDFLSRQHCTVTVENNTIHVVDLDSSNGIYFHGKKTKKVEILDKAEIEIGEIKVLFELSNLSTQETIIEEKTNIRDLSKISIDKNQEQTLTKKSTEPKKALKKEATSKVKFHPANEKSKISKEEKSTPKLPFEIALPAVPEIKQSSVHAELPPEAIVPNVPFYSEKSAKTETEKPVQVHQYASQLRPQQRVLESFVTWKDQIYNLQQYAPNSEVIVGHGEHANLEVPVLKEQFPIANYDGNNTQVVIPDRFKFELERDNKTLSFEDLVKSQIVAKKNNSYVLKLGATELVTVQVTNDVAIHLRYAPAPRQLSKDLQFLKEKELRTPAYIIGFIELVIIMVILLSDTKEVTPQKIMQERVARLIVPPPPPKKEEPPPPPEPKPEPPKVVKKREPPKKQVKKPQPKPQKVVKLQKSKLLAKVNKYPVEVAKPMKVADRPVVTNVQQVGALAALNAMSSSAPVSNQPVAININKNAGGQTALNTGGVIGTLKTSSGKLAAGGYAQVKTKGLGYGTGTGYGVQGIKGTAGGRAVAGTVVGQPSLVRLSKEEGLTRAQVMDVVKKYMSQIQQCYERSLIESPGLAGRVEYEWEIKASGSVNWAKVKKAEMSGGDTLNNCVVGIFKGMKFPQAKNGQNTIPNIGFPFGKI